mgnify:FL=1
MSEEAPGHRNFHCALTRRDMSILPVLLNTTALLATIDINILTYIFVFFLQIYFQIIDILRNE